MSDADNPFAALLQTPDVSKKEENTTEIIERIFGFTLNKVKRDYYIYLEDLSQTFPTNELNVEVLEHALFERLLINNPQDYITNDKFCSREDKKCANSVIAYLFNCFKKVQELKNEELKKGISELVLRNTVTSLKQPDLYVNQDLYFQLYNALKIDPQAHYFLSQVYEQFLKEEDNSTGLNEPFTKLLNIIHVDTARASIGTFPEFIFNVLNVYAVHESLASILLDYCQPKDLNIGSEYANTLIGALFCVSILPKTANGEHEYFQDMVDPATTAGTEGILWSNSNLIAQHIHTLFLNLLKCSPLIRAKTLTWLGNCLKANSDRGKLWNSQMPEFNSTNLTTVNDGFMLNFGNLMVRLCVPFCTNVTDGKILKVDPTYCAVPNEECEKKGIHLLDMFKETCLIPITDSEEQGSSEGTRPTSASYNFVSECFFMAHRAFDLGFRVDADKIVRLNQELSRIERAFQEASSQAGAINDIVTSIRQRMNSELSKYLSLKCVMNEPHFTEAVFNFMSATAFWLSQVAVNVEFPPLKFQNVTFPLPDKIPDSSKCIPEFIVENVVCYLIFLRRFNPNVFEEQGYEKMKPFFTFILIYMGSSRRTKNPHLRAHLAEALEAFLPHHKDYPPGFNKMGGIERERIFAQHEHRSKIVEMLLDVFVGIEMTGQSVQFEQKFNYRRPMYSVMDYLWEIKEYKQYFMNLAKEAEQNMEAVCPPLFLRFINLLINDAIFLLDESLANMSKLREMQTAREKGEWDTLPIQERTQNMAYMQHVGMLAKFDNILGRDTISTLERLTSQITIVFTHSTMVDRVAAMLNYFLLNLVGPNQKNFKVKDYKEYSFDPAQTVMDICKIYTNLKGSEQFCLAVSQDGRSYSPQLFSLAEDVLVRIGGGTLVGELQEVAQKVSEKAAEYQTNEEVIAEAPEHFLDPIMSTLMLDPVILPSSKQTVDRSTIARHLLSDQTDPFNRAPLSMDQVIPNKELADEIRQWLDERKANR